MTRPDSPSRKRLHGESVTIQNVAQVLSYSCPATESTTAVAADPAIPAALLAPPEQRKIREKPGIRRQRHINDSVIFGLTFCFFLYNLLRLIVFAVVPSTQVKVIAEGTGLIGTDYAPTVQFTYTSLGFRHIQSEEVSRRFYDDIRPFGEIAVHMVSLGPLRMTEIDRPWTEFVRDHLAVLLASACLLFASGVYSVWRFFVRPRRYKMECVFGLQGTATIARIVDNDDAFLARFFGVGTITYRYTITDGSELDATVKGSSLRGPKQIGTPFVVLYLPGNPHRHRAYVNAPFIVELA